MPKLVILSYNMYPYLLRPELKISGGAELQLYILAQQLQQKGYEIVFLTGDFGQEDELNDKGFRFIKLEKRGSGAFLKLMHFTRLLRRLRPDYVLERGTSAYTFLIAGLCKLYNYPYIFCAASDINFSKDEIDPSFSENRMKQKLYHWALKWVSHFVVQKKSQAELLKKNFGITKNVFLIRNFMPESLTGMVPDTGHKPVYDAIWVGNFIPYKQPELFIELARLNPEKKFLMIGSSPDEEYNRKLKKTISSITNLIATGYQPPESIAGWMRQCRMVVNTTCIGNGYEEGFSNVQIMGWVMGLPSLSLISDPDAVIATYQLGFCSGTMDQLNRDFATLADNADWYEKSSRNAIEYVKRHHSTSQLLQQYEQILNKNKSKEGADPQSE